MLQTIAEEKRLEKFETNRIKAIPGNPFKHRKSIYFENQNIRDLIFKGYTVVFRISENQIEIFGFVKYQKDPID